MATHTGMLWLPDEMRARGFNAWELEGWEAAQGNYQWTDPFTDQRSYDGVPSLHVVHHTVGYPVTPVVRTPSGRWSKANVWAGLLRDDGKLYPTGAGVPTLAFTSSGPARISTGYGHWPTLEQVVNDERVYWDQQAADQGEAANRFAWSVETAHPGNGTELDPRVVEMLAQMGAALSQRFGWSPWRTIGHLTWTRRKIDPYWNGRLDAIVPLQDRVAAIMNAGPVVPPVDPPDPGDDLVDIGRNVQYVLEGDTGQDVEYWQVRCIEAIKQVKYYGNSNKTFITTEAPQLTFKVWDEQMTAYLSAWTGRNSHGIGATERVMIENAIAVFYN